MELKVDYKIYKESDICPDVIQIVAELLKKQNRVTPPFEEKAKRCKYICIAYNNCDEPIGLGAIKIKTESDFSDRKSGLNELQSKFEWELGYIYVDGSYRSMGIATTIVEKLINEFGEDSLMATTEFEENISMVNILQKNGFKMRGNSWLSKITKNKLGLFLRFKS